MIYHVLDSTTPWFEWLSYQECCWSLDVIPSLSRFMKYNQYYKSIMNGKTTDKS
jgi:hypothetical protein